MPDAARFDRHQASLAGADGGAFKLDLNHLDLLLQFYLS